jgi:tRNA threonylcarbamoyl adenosine modification protein YeaZ
VVLVIDTSSACFAVAVLSAAREPQGESVAPSGREQDLRRQVLALVAPQRLTRVAVATGPGSFTGLRVGAAYALGLALGRRIPVHALPTLELAALRARVPATGLSEAGRGRVYFQPPGAEVAAGEPVEVPTNHPAVGWLREATAASLRAAGVRLLEEPELRTFGDAAALALERAPELPYGRLKLEYMQSFEALSGPRKSTDFSG